MVGLCIMLTLDYFQGAARAGAAGAGAAGQGEARAGEEGQGGAGEEGAGARQDAGARDPEGEGQAGHGGRQQALRALHGACEEGKPCLATSESRYIPHFLHKQTSLTAFP